MPRTLYPPVEPRPTEIVIHREWRDTHLVLYFAWGESFSLSADETIAYLRMLDEPSPAKVVDLVWNFYAVYYSVVDHEALIIPQSAVREIFQSKNTTYIAAGA